MMVYAGTHSCCEEKIPAELLLLAGLDFHPEFAVGHPLGTGMHHTSAINMPPLHSEDAVSRLTELYLNTYLSFNRIS